MAKDYIDKKNESTVKYLYELTKNMPRFVMNFVYALVKGGEDGRFLSHKLGTAKEYTLALKKFLNATIYSPARTCNESEDRSQEEQLNYLQNLTKQQFEQFFEENPSDNIRRSRTQAIKAFYAYLHLKGLISFNPLISYRPQVGKRAPKKDVCFTKEDKEKLIRTVADKEGVTSKKEQEMVDKTALRDTIIILLITEEGFTITDITALDISDYDPKEHTLAKASVKQDIRLDAKIVTLMDRYLELSPSAVFRTDTRSSFGPQEGEQALFIGRKRERLAERSVSYMIKNLIRRTFGDDSKLTPAYIRKRED